MKRVWTCIVFVLLLLISVPSTSFAEEQDTYVEPKIVKQGDIVREAKKYESIQYEPMTYIDDKWYFNTNEVLEKWKTTIKNAVWSINLTIAQLGFVIAFNVFSLDIIDLIKDSLTSIMSDTARIITQSVLLAFFALSGGYIVIKAYVRQDWGEFISIFTKVFISMVLLYSLLSSSGKVITFTNETSKFLEGLALQVNPTLTTSHRSEVTAQNGSLVTPNEMGAIFENKMYDAMLYKPYLYLSYGTTNEKEITKDDKDRVSNYLEADINSEEGIKKRKEITKSEFEELNNRGINARNITSQVGYISTVMIANILQIGIVFFLALLRILIQMAFIMLLLLFPLVLLASLFPSFENLSLNYIKSIFIVIGYKAISVFLVIVSVSFITLGYEMMASSNDIYYNMFISTIMSTCVIALWFMRDFLKGAFSSTHRQIINHSSTMTDAIAGKMGTMALAGGRELLKKEKQDSMTQRQQALSGFKSLKNLGGVVSSRLRRADHEELRTRSATDIRDAHINAEHVNVAKQEIAAASQDGMKNHLKERSNEVSPHRKSPETQQPLSQQQMSNYQKAGSKPKQPTTQPQDQTQNMKKTDSNKHLTKWEAQQQLNDRKQTEPNKNKARNESPKPSLQVIKGDEAGRELPKGMTAPEKPPLRDNQASLLKKKSTHLNTSKRTFQDGDHL